MLMLLAAVGCTHSNSIGFILTMKTNFLRIFAASWMTGSLALLSPAALAIQPIAKLSALLRTIMRSWRNIMTMWPCRHRPK